MTASDFWTAASAVFAGASAVAAAVAIYAQLWSQKNRDILDQAILSMVRAYDALTDNSKQVMPVRPERMNWLTCARHLESYKSLKRQITSRLHRDLCGEHEEYWRHQFYLCLDIPNIHDPGYYAENGREGKAGIDVRSALVIYAFATWPRTKPDPIDGIDVEHLVAKADPLKANIGLRLYVSSFKQFCNLGDRQ